MNRAFGVTAGLNAAVAEPLAGRCGMLGYASVWSNDIPDASGLDTLATFARSVPGIDVGVAVLALDRHQPADIARRIEELGLPRERLWVGVGAGFEERPVTRMREALPELREALPDVKLVLAAMGPKMCALAGEEYDGAFFNWMTPEFAAGARERVHAGALEAGRQPPPVLGYVRTAVGDDAAERLRKDEGFYREYHDGYRKHFERLGAEPGTVGIAAASPYVAQAELARYDDVLDVVVVRALASATVGAMTGLAEAAAPGGTEARTI
jgi:alkanesulfonate monooxygenase SsuD/methylene tetrahydromethanopterin reductase-like flavin-dependent oxidoreductase (luciferase family)